MEKSKEVWNTAGDLTAYPGIAIIHSKIVAYRIPVSRMGESTIFTGFSPETIDFLWGIRFNNNKPWFESQKQIYVNQLYEPMKQLAREVSEPFQEDPGTLCKVSRIYRDARLRHAGGPYKETLWFCLRRDDRYWNELPCLFFEIGPEHYSYGFLLWSPKADTMEAFRKRLEAHPAEFLKIVQKIETETEVRVSGREYYRKKPCPDDALLPYYQFKNILAYVEKPIDDALFSPQLAEMVRKNFTALWPLYRYCLHLTD